MRCLNFCYSQCKSRTPRVVVPGGDEILMSPLSCLPGLCGWPDSLGCFKLHDVPQYRNTDEVLDVFSDGLKVSGVCNFSNLYIYRHLSSTKHSFAMEFKFLSPCYLFQLLLHSCFLLWRPALKMP